MADFVLCRTNYLDLQTNLYNKNFDWQKDRNHLITEIFEVRKKRRIGRNCDNWNNKKNTETQKPESLEPLTFLNIEKKLDFIGPNDVRIRKNVVVKMLTYFVPRQTAASPKGWPNGPVLCSKTS